MSTVNMEKMKKGVENKKEEIKHLQIELEQLIKLGISNQITNNNENKSSLVEQRITFRNASEVDNLNGLKSPKQAAIVSRSRPTARRQINMPETKTAQDELPKRVCTYNKEEAREYIRKQRERRKQQAQNETKAGKVDVDLKKQKLKELHQKSLQLLAKSVKLKRERSKSRDNEKTEQNAQKVVAEDKTEHFTNGLVPDLIASNVELPRKHHPQIGNITVRANSCLLKKAAAVPAGCSNKNVIKENGNGKSKVENVVLANDPLPNDFVVSIDVPNEDHLKVSKLASLPCNDNQIIDVEADRNKAAIKIQNCWRKYKKNKIKNIFEQFSVKTGKERVVAVEKPAINETPVWLQPAYIVPHPYSFINTVKRKLQLAIKTPPNSASKLEKSVQVDQIEVVPSNRVSRAEKSIQISGFEVPLKNDRSESKKDNTKSSDLKSFLSHRCLDVANSKPPDLQPPSLKLSAGLKTHSKNNDCESDTSKDIPDISTESSTNFKEKHSSDGSSQKSDNKLVLDKDKLKHLRLRDFNLSKRLHDSVKSGHITSISNGFISEHVTSVAETFIKESIKSNRNFSGRDTIIASNTSKYTDSNKNTQNNDSAPTKKTTQSSVSEVADEITDRFFKKIHSVESKSDQAQTQSARSQQSDNYSSAFASVVPSTQSVLSLKPSAASLVSKRSQITTSRVSIETRIDGEATSGEATSVNELREASKTDDVKLTGPIQNIQLRSGERIERDYQSQGNSNQIHLKFEAELHLLNNFNESLKNFINMEKENEVQKTIDLKRNIDTQTSFVNSTASEDVQMSANRSSDKQSKVSSEKQIPTINYSRGSSDLNDISYSSISTSELKETDASLTGLELSRMRSSSNEKLLEQSSFTVEQINKNPYIRLSLEMFEQLIKDEDTRIENLKTILKIREKALLDRTKSELACLEVQKKQLKVTGQLHEISLLKKRQRGIIIKLQHEQLEMQRLKQAQKAASRERKTILKEQRNMIKAQLSTNEMLGKIKLNTPRERRNSGPLKVYNIQSHHNESIKSETSISKKSSENEELINVKTHSVVSRITECEIGMAGDRENLEFLKSGSSTVRNEHAKKTLLMREAQLQKRRKAAEELLRWHQKLLEEEKKVAELEMAANSIITSAPRCESFTAATEEPSNGKRTFKGSQLNSVWQNMTGRQDKKFSDKETYSVSEFAVEQFCLDAKSALNKNSDVASDKNSENNSSIKTVPDETSVTSLNNQNLLNSQQCNNSIKSNLINSKSSNSVIEDLNRKSASPSTVSYTSDFDLTNKTTSHDYNDLKTKTPSDEHEKISTITELIDNFSKVSKEITQLSKNSNSIVANVDEIEKSLTRPKTFSLITDNSSIILDSIENLKSSIQEITRSSKNLGSRRSSRNEQNKSATIKELLPAEQDSSDTVKSSTEDVPNEIEESAKHDMVVSENVSTTVDEDLPTDASNDENQKTEKLIVTSENVESNEKTTSQTAIQEIVPEINEFPDSKEIPESIEAREIEKSVDSDFIVNNLSENKNESVELVDETIEKDLSDAASDININSCDEIKSIELDDDSRESIKNESEKSKSIESESDATNNYIIFSNQSDALKHAKLQEDALNHTAINEQVDEIEENIDDKIELTDKNDEITSESFNKSTERILDLSYGIIGCKKASNSIEEDVSTDSTENDSHQSLDKSVVESATLFPESKTSHESVIKSVESKASQTSHEQSNRESIGTETIKSGEPSTTAQSDSPKTPVDVKKRVSEILADASTRSNDKSPRLQDLYVTTYDVISPAHSPELGSPESEKSLFSAKLYGNEAEELLKKQLAIEQEIKRLEQQQKEQIPYLFVREIPNKPPPPYTPPITAQTPAIKSVLPTDVEQIKFITDFSSEILHEAYTNNALDSIKLSEQTLALKSGASKIDKSSCEFIFDLCKEIASKHYAQFENDTGPIWMHQIKKQKLAANNPPDKNSLEDLLNKKIKELLGFEKIEQKESAIIKWSRKKRDHVDEILVLESQSEESEWTDYNRDELIVKNEVTSDILNALLSETAAIFNAIAAKKGSVLY